MPKIRIAPSILSADFASLGADIAKVASVADILHLDVMDGHFVPNITFGPPLVASVRKATKMFLDVHLMITYPQKYVEAFAKAGADLISFHVESQCDPVEVVKQIRGLGKQVGVTLNPDVPIERLEPVLDLVDMVLIMTVPAGFGGQAFREDCLEKVRWVRKRKPELSIEVDGGISVDTIGRVTQAGADTFVAGTAVFGKADPAAAVNELRRLAESANVG